MKAFLLRLRESNIQTLGSLSFFDDDLTRIFSCYSLELPYRANLRCVSCIDKGEYIVQRRRSDKFKEHLHITDVKDRDWILIHPANKVQELLGCIAVGERLADIDSDGTIDVTSSRKTLDIILSLMIERNITEFKLTIT